MNFTHIRHSRRRWLRPQGILLPVLATVVIYAATKTWLDEQNLQQASLLELQVDAQQDSNNPRIFYYLGLRAQQAGQKDLALDSLGRAATMSPHDEGTWLAWARAAA